MERNQGPQAPFEVYCYNCQTSFAAGTKICVHCGNRIGRIRPGPAGNLIPDLSHPDDSEEEGEEIGVRESLGKRLGGMAVWIAIVLGASLMRLCNGE